MKHKQFEELVAMTESKSEKSWFKQNLVALITIVVLLVAAYPSYLYYQYAYERDQPLIQVVGHPQLIGVWWVGKPIQIQQKQNLILPMNSPTNPFVIAVAPETLYTQIKITNTGQRIAYIIGLAYYDTVSFEPIIRRRNTHLVVTDTNWTVTKLDRLYDIPRNDTIALKFKHPLNNLHADSLILHYMILYDDDGKFHDTYYWALYRVASDYRPKVQDYFIYQDDQRSYYTYTKEESSIFKEVTLQKLNLTIK